MQAVCSSQISGNTNPKKQHHFLEELNHQYYHENQIFYVTVFNFVRADWRACGKLQSINTLDSSHWPVIHNVLFEEGMRKLKQ
jgi:pyruvate dehydrogenase complex dehydrogenase (E1) component